jgi:hypothetical protein
MHVVLEAVVGKKGRVGANGDISTLEKAKETLKPGFTFFFFFFFFGGCC